MQEIVVVLDMSGSMHSCRESAMEGFNQFLIDQKKLGEASLTRIWFDDKVEKDFSDRMTKMKNLTKWRHGGMTALHDAIGYAYKYIEDKYESVDMDIPKKGIVAILTDGGENASKEHTAESVKALIKKFEEEYEWETIFLAADQDAVTVGTNLGMKMQNTINFAKGDTREAFAVYSATVASYRVENND